MASKKLQKKWMGECDNRDGKRDDWELGMDDDEFVVVALPSSFARTIQRVWRKHAKRYPLVAFGCIDVFACDSHLVGSLFSNRGKWIHYCALNCLQSTSLGQYMRLGRVKPNELVGRAASGKSTLLDSYKSGYLKLPEPIVFSLLPSVEKSFGEKSSDEGDEDFAARQHEDASFDED